MSSGEKVMIVARGKAKNEEDSRREQVYYNLALVACLGFCDVIDSSRQNVLKSRWKMIRLLDLSIHMFFFFKLVPVQGLWELLIYFISQWVGERTHTRPEVFNTVPHNPLD